jgi:predicted transposase YbfD/YdcC
MLRLVTVCEEKSNEITAIPELLKLLALKGTTVTIDAMGCQAQIASQIRERKGHYVLALKGNQSGLQDDMRRLYEQAIDTDFAGLTHEVHQTSETGHGRMDERTCQVIGIPKDYPQRGKWKDLSTLAAVTSRRVMGGKETWETRLYVSSHPPRAKLLAESIRRHWSVENSQNWVQGVAFGEDLRRQDWNGAANLAAVRRLAISLLRQEKTNQRGAKNKRLHCVLDASYLLRVLHTARF